MTRIGRILTAGSWRGRQATSFVGGPDWGWLKGAWPMAATGDRPLSAPVGAVLFVDLTGYGALTETCGDEAAADVATRFASLVRRSLVQGARVVKTLGDGVLVVAPDVSSARATAWRVRGGVSADNSLPPVHAGLCGGTVVWRDDDVFG